MGTLDVTRKVSFVGEWREDVFTDALVKKIAACASSEKGKKMKVRLNREGVKLTRSRFLQESKINFYPLTRVKTVAKNPFLASCVMFVLSDEVKKYNIIALRTASEGDASHINSVFAEIKKDQKVANIELKKRDNGNWTLRERSAHNANKHMAEIFSERNKPNGDVNTGPNGDVTHVPVLDKSKEHNNDNKPKGMYVKRYTTNNITTTTTHNNNNNSKPDKDKVDGDDDNFVIETEVTNYPYTVEKPNTRDHEAEAIQGELEAILEQASLEDRRNSAGGPQILRYQRPPSQTSHRNRPVVYTSGQPVVYRAPHRVYEARMTSAPAGVYTNPWASHRRVSGTYQMLPTRVSHDDSGRNSLLKVKFDTESIRSNTSRLSRISRRLRSSDRGLSTTIERPIEETYARPIIIRRYGYAHRPRPATYHPGYTNELRVYHDDVAL